MATLENRSPSETYKDLLQVSNANSGIDATARVVSDGEGTDSKLFLDTNRVGVGIAPTDGTLHVHTATAGSVTPDGDADDLVVENSASGGISILTPDANPGRLAFGSPSDPYGAVIMHQQSTGKLSINTEGGTGNISMATGSGITAMTIDSSQNVGIGTGSDTIDAPLHVKGATTVAKFQSSSGATNTLYTDSSDAMVGQIEFGASESQIVTRTSSRLSLGSNNVQTLHITDDDRIGVGTASPSSYDSGANNLVIFENGHSGITIASGTSSSGSIHFADGTSGNESFRGVIAYNHSSEVLQFATVGVNNGYQLKLDQNSRISLSNNDSGTSNTIFGKNAGASLDDGSNYNTFIGENVSDASMNDATYNVGIGYNALTDLTSGDSNIAVGALCSENITTGNENTAVGTSAMRNSTTGSNNVAVGREAMGSGVTTGDNNVAVGKNSGLDITSGANNTFIGKDSAQNVTDGNENVIIGDGAGQTTTSVHDVVVIGRGAMQNGNVTNSADGTVAVGYKSLEALTSAQRMTAIGFEALKLEDAGSFQTAVGYQALSQVNNDNGHNTALGQRAGYNLTTGNANTLIGSSANASGSGGVNQTVIGQGATGTGNNEIALGNTSVTAIKAQVSSITAYSSDERTKKDIQDYDLKGLDFIKDLQLKTYIYKNPADFPDEIRSSKWNEEGVEKPADPTETQVGLIAQEVEEALKKHGIGNVETYAPTQDSGIKTLTYGNLIFPLIKAVQELSAKVTELENK
jgi:hypothetical protein